MDELTADTMPVLWLWLVPELVPEVEEEPWLRELERMVRVSSR